MPSHIVPRTLRLPPSLAVLVILPWILVPQAASLPVATPIPPACPHPADLAPDGAAHNDDGLTALARDRHLARLGVDRWHAAGHRGRGVKVAILDSGFH